MLNLILLVVIGAICIALKQSQKTTDKLANRLSQLDTRLADLEKSISPASKAVAEAAAQPSLPFPAAAAPPPALAAPEEDGEAEAAELLAPGPGATAAAPGVPPAVRSIFWAQMERQFLENWTGILGAVIMVMGVSFFGIYASLQLSPVLRFSLIVLFTGVLEGSFHYLKSRRKWLALALWLRSSAGAIFLFACLGAGGIPGLQWLDHPLAALALLSGGILLNLYLGYSGGTETFASLHVLLSLISLAIAPQGNITLILAALVAITGIVLTYREKWDYHLLLTISSFSVYHLFWFWQSATLTSPEQLIGRMTVLMVFIPAAFLHYRRDYLTKTFAALPFTVHLLNWFYLGGGLLLHATGQKWKTLLIVAGAIAAFFLARTAKKREIRWLYHTDTVIAQLLAIFSLITLSSWEISALTIKGLIFLEMLAFLAILLQEEEELLYRWGSSAMHLMGSYFIGSAFLAIDQQPAESRYRQALLLLLCAVSGVYFHLRTLRRGRIAFDAQDSYGYLDRRLHYSGVAILSGGLLWASYANVYQIPWSEYGVGLLALPLLYLRQKYQSNSLGLGLLALLGGTHALFWGQLLTHDQPGLLAQCGHLLPFLLLSLACLKWSYLQPANKHLTWIGIYLLALNLAIAVYELLQPFSPLLPGVVWLTLSLLALAASSFYDQKEKEALAYQGDPGRHLLHVGYFLIYLFLLRHILVHLQVEEYLGIFKIRLLIELFALSVFFSWASAKKAATPLAPARGDIFSNPLFTELIIIFSVFTISLEVNEFWHPILWMVGAFACLYLGTRYAKEYSRLRFYSLLLNWAAAFQVAFLTSSYVSPASSWQEQAWVSGAIAILLQFGFIYYCHHHCRLTNVSYPQSLTFLHGWTKLVGKQMNGLAFYPIIACVWIFAYCSFDKSILTLLWVGECFLVFILSIVLQEEHFRYISFAGLGISIFRLIFFDLSQANTITKSFVFFCVGIIMLLINSAYNKYRHRFSHE